MFKGNIQQAIVNNQDILTDGWQGNYFVIVDNVADLTPDESQQGHFCKRLYIPSDFKGIKKNN